MVDYEGNFLDQLRNKIIKGIIVEQEHNNPTITQQRRDICSDCDEMDTDTVTCKICGCFLAVKTISLVNYNISTGKSEITNCPLNKWQDEYSKYFHELKHKEDVTQKN